MLYRHRSPKADNQAAGKIAPWLAPAVIMSLSFIATVSLMGLSPREWAVGITMGLTILAIQYAMIR